LIDKVPTESPSAVGLSRPILVSASSSAEGALTILPANTVLPASKTIQASVTTAQSYLSVFVGPESASDSAVKMGEVVFDALAVPTTVEVTVSVDLNSSVTVVVRAIGALEALASLTISADP